MASTEKYQDSNGKDRWAARWRQDGQQVKKRGFTTEKKAQTFANTQEADARRGLTATRSDITVGEYARYWASTRKRKPSSEPGMETVLRRLESSSLGKRKLGEVLHSQVQLWVTRDLGHLANSTAKRDLGYLAAIFRLAEKDGLVTRSPVGKVSEIAIANAPKHEDFIPLTVEQVEALAEAMPPRYRAMVITQAGLGLRIGELFGLRVSDVDFLRREVRVTEQFPGTGKVRTTLKTRFSVRTLPLPRRVAEVLAAHLATFGSGEDGTIFTTGRGTSPSRPYFFGEVFPKAVVKAGLPEGTSSHDLRHHYATELLAAGLSVVEVGKLLGHRDGALVAKTYGHAPVNATARAMAAMDAAWAV